MRLCPKCGRAIKAVKGNYDDHTIRKDGGPKCPMSGKPVEMPWKNG